MLLYLTSNQKSNLIDPAVRNMTLPAKKLVGAELIFYPTAIGSEPILDCDSMEHWRRTMQGHAAANVTPVIAANRFGLEAVHPCPENGNQSSSLNFYGSSFLTDATGALIAQADRTGEAVLTAEIGRASCRERV